MNWIRTFDGSQIDPRSIVAVRVEQRHPGRLAAILCGAGLVLGSPVGWGLATITRMDSPGVWAFSSLALGVGLIIYALVIRPAFSVIVNAAGREHTIATYPTHEAAQYAIQMLGR
jgi:hypothetical protein